VVASWWYADLANDRIDERYFEVRKRSDQRSVNIRSLALPAQRYLEMNVDQKLTAIRDIIQQDAGNRGLARDPKDNLITACPEDFANACASVADHPKPHVTVLTGFIIPTVDPPTAETDGPLGALFLARVLDLLEVQCSIMTEVGRTDALKAALAALGLFDRIKLVRLSPTRAGLDEAQIIPTFRRVFQMWAGSTTHLLALERVGPNHTLDSLRHQRNTSDADIARFATSVPTGKRDKYFTMRGLNVRDLHAPAHIFFESDESWNTDYVTIGIGDGGNEIGMGKIPWSTICRNIPNGELISCRIPADHLVVAGVSNWGAYALAAGVAVLRGRDLPDELFSPDHEEELLRLMVHTGPLVDGVTGQQTATVDGLTWEQYIQPLVEIGKIVRG
jgi:hypothetical protein